MRNPDTGRESGSSRPSRSSLCPMMARQSSSLDWIDFEQGALGPLPADCRRGQRVLRERLIHCDQFRVTRISGQLSFVIGAAGVQRLLVSLLGHCRLVYADENRSFRRGDVLLLPAAVGACACLPLGRVSLLEIRCRNSQRQQAVGICFDCAMSAAEWASSSRAQPADRV